MFGLTDGKFFDLHGDAAGFELGENHFADVGGQFLDQSPVFPDAEFQKALGDREIINGVGDGI